LTFASKAPTRGVKARVTLGYCGFSDWAQSLHQIHYYSSKAHAQTPPTCAAAVASAPARDRGSACLVQVAEAQTGWMQLSETRFDVVLLFVYFHPRRAARHVHPFSATTGWMTLIAQDIQYVELSHALVVTSDCLTSENQATISVPLLTPWRSAKEAPSDPCFSFSLLPPALILVMPRSLACEHPGVVRSSPRLAVLSAIVPKSRLPWSRASAKAPESAGGPQTTNQNNVDPTNQSEFALTLTEKTFKQDSTVASSFLVSSSRTR
jgi:hypothetical protein